MPPIQNQDIIKNSSSGTSGAVKKLRRTVYEVDETMKEVFIKKNTEDSLEKRLEYCKQLVTVIKETKTTCSYPKVKEKSNLFRRIYS